MSTFTFRGETYQYDLDMIGLTIIFHTVYFANLLPSVVFSIFLSWIVGVIIYTTMTPSRYHGVPRLQMWCVLCLVTLAIFLLPNEIPVAIVLIIATLSSIPVKAQ